jgi:hypothetical protein
MGAVGHPASLLPCSAQKMWHVRQDTVSRGAEIAAMSSVSYTLPASVAQMEAGVSFASSLRSLSIITRFAIVSMSDTIFHTA